MWKNCSIHVAFSALGSLLFVVSAVGGAIYLYLGRFELPDKSEHFSKLVNKIRYRLNFTYTSVGFILFTIGVGLGFLRAKEVWHGYFKPDAKVIVSIIIWLYYLAFFAIITRLSLKNAPNKERVFSILSFVGAILILINFVIVNFYLTSLHHYL